MAWNPQNGGPWGGGGQGGPWGRGPGGPQPPDIEELLRRGQDRFKNLVPGGFGASRGLALLLMAAAALWLASGIYRVDTAQQGVVMLFGRVVDSSGPGLHWYLPAPIGHIETPNVERINRLDVGFRGAADGIRNNAVRDVQEESLMITGDQNIADVDFTVFWKIKDATSFLFNLRDPEGTVKVAAESAMREVIGQANLQDALTGGRDQIQIRMRTLLQDLLDNYGAGITVTQVQLLKVDPPSVVIDSFNEVQRARQDKERKQNEAEAYRNKLVPTARGEAEKINQDAIAYKVKVIKDAEGEAKRFLAVYESYTMAKDITKQRLYIEAMEDILRDTDKLIADRQESGGVIPYLPLPELKKHSGTEPADPRRRPVQETKEGDQ